MDARKLLMDAVEASHSRIGRPRRLLIGLSGGADSMALAATLMGLRERLALTIHCVHVNHGLREAAGEDEAFVRRYCDANDLPLIVKRVDVARKGSLELTARTARYAAFEAAMAESQAEVIALGHHLNDQAETVLMRLMRGSGPGGLQAMRELRGQVWRPLLQIHVSAIRQALQELQQPWREDESNQEARHLRNALRRDVMPMLESLVPGAAGGLARSAAILADENAYWSDFVANWLHEHASTALPCVFLMLEPFRQLPLAAQRRVLLGLCAAGDIQPEFDHLERMLALAEGLPNRWENLPKMARVLRGKERLHLVLPEVEPLHLGEVVREPGAPAFQPKRALVQAVDLDRVAGATLRYRQPSDRFRPIHAGGSKLLSEYLSDQQVDLPFRDHWPVLAKGDELLWLPGISLGESAAIGPDTRRPGLLRYQGSLPHQLNIERMQRE